MTFPKSPSGVRIAAGATAVALALGGCSTGPSTQAEVCQAFDELASQAMRGNGLGNPLFDAIDSLADKAGSYDGDAQVKQSAEQLKDIADSDSTSIAQLESATTAIGSMCGGSLTMNAFTGP